VKVILKLKAAMPQKGLQMVEHEVAMAIHHLKEWHQRNHPSDSGCDPKSWMSVECALSWLEDAQTKMDAARKTRPLVKDMTDQGKWDVRYGKDDGEQKCQRHRKELPNE
jgi:hypothetical protein